MSAADLDGAYRDGSAWRAGPHVVYRRLAAAAIEALDRDVAGMSTVDVGAGTGAMGVGEELAARGARVVYADRSLAMARAAPAPRLVCDIRSLGLRTRQFDLAVASFVLSHVDDPGSALAELARVTRRGGTVLVTAFPAGDRHPVKEAVGAVLAQSGWVPQAWYERLKRTGEARVGDPEALATLAGAAGLAGVRVSEVAAPLGGLAAGDVVAWRLGMAQVAAYYAGLPAAQREALTAAATRAVERIGLAQRRILVLVGEVP